MTFCWRHCRRQNLVFFFLFFLFFFSLTRVKNFYNSFRVKDKNSFRRRKIWHLFASTEPRCRRDISISFRPLTMIFFFPAGNFKALELIDDDFLNSFSTFWFGLWYFLFVYFLVHFCYSMVFFFFFFLHIYVWRLFVFVFFPRKLFFVCHILMWLISKFLFIIYIFCFVLWICD